MVQGQGRARPVSGSSRPDSRKAMALSTRAGSLVSASAAAIAASHMAGGVEGGADWAGGCCFVRAKARPGISKRQINSRGIDAFVHENGVLTRGLILPNGTVRNKAALFSPPRTLLR